MTTSHPCCLCSQIGGRADDDLIASLLPGDPYVRRVMLETASFAVVPSLGPLAPGHALLCPKAHVRSFAQVGEDLAAELDAIKTHLRSTLAAIYASDVTVFEHGSAASGDRILCTVAHAHLHFVPLPARLRGGVDVINSWTAFDGSLTSLRRLAGRHEYLSYEAPSGECRLLVSPGVPLESQYLRKAIAARLGDATEWNWRTAPRPRQADATWRAFIEAERSSL